MSADPARLEVYCHDVGQGDCTIIVPPHGEGDPILFDCADPDVAERFFANHDIKRLEAVVVSHLDTDHVRGILPFLQQHFAQGGEVGRLVLAKEREELAGGATDLMEAALAWDKTPPHEGFQLLPPFRTGAPVQLSSGKGWSVDLVRTGRDRVPAPERHHDHAPAGELRDPPHVLMVPRTRYLASPFFFFAPRAIQPVPCFERSC